MTILFYHRLSQECWLSGSRWCQLLDGLMLVAKMAASILNGQALNWWTLHFLFETLEFQRWMECFCHSIQTHLKKNEMTHVTFLKQLKLILMCLICSLRTVIFGFLVAVPVLSQCQFIKFIRSIMYILINPIVGQVEFCNT